MSTAVHGKTSLAEMLLANGAAPSKSSEDDSDKTNTVDFGATLMSLIDQNLAGKAGSGANNVAASSTPLSQSVYGQKPSTTFDPSSAGVDERFSMPAPTRNGASKSRSSASSDEVDSHRTSARGDSFPTVADSLRSGDEASEKSTPAKAGDQDASASASSDRATIDPATQPARVALPAQAGIAATIDSPVSDPDIALDFRKQPFAAKGSNDASSATATQITASKNFAKVANPAPIEADADLAVHSTPRATDAAHSRPGPATDGTSTALSSPKGMNSEDAKNTQTLAKLPADSTAASTPTTTSQTQMEAFAASAPEDQRSRTNSKDTASQPADASILANGSGNSPNAQAVVRSAETATIRLNPEVSPTRDPARSVSITVQLASGQTAEASVRERAGAVDVKILTPTAASAQRVSSEMDALRQNLDAAGISLGHSEVSYQQGNGGGGQGREGYQPPAQNQAANGKEVFIINEVVQ